MPSPTFFKSMTMILYVWGDSPGQRGWSRPCDQHSHRKTFHWDKQRCLVRLSRPAFGAGKTDFDRIYYIVNLAITVVVVDLDERNSVAPIETSEIWSRVVKRGHLRSDLGLSPKNFFLYTFPYEVFTSALIPLGLEATEQEAKKAKDNHRVIIWGNISSLRENSRKTTSFLTG